MKNSYSRNRVVALFSLSLLIVFKGTVTTGAAPQKTATDTIRVTPDKGSVATIWKKEHKIIITFPTAMVAAEKLRGNDHQCPIVFEPPLNVSWRWMSQTEGELYPDFRYGGGVRNIMYRAKLQKDLRDLEGNLIQPQNWGAQFADDSFALSGVEFLNAVRTRESARSKSESEISEEPDAEPEEKGDGEAAIERRAMGDKLPARPRVRLEFSRDVKIEDVAKAVVFEDSVSHEQFPVEVNLEGVQTDSPLGWVLVEPVKPLPPGRTYLLVVQRISASASSEKLPRQRVLPAGKTYPITITVVAGYNQPVKGAFVRIRASKPFDAESATVQSIGVEPPVAKLKINRDLRNPRTIELLGDFDTSKVYKVTLKAGLKSVDQFVLEKDSVWTARFLPKRPAVIARETEFLFQRASAAKVVGTFVQVNTGKLEWKIAPIPAEKIPVIWKRLREFGSFVQDEKGEIVTDPVKAEHVRHPTELLIPALGLPVVASGSFEPSDGDRETARKVEWKPGDHEPGLYLLEISGSDSAGRTVGNRSLISRGDWVITRINLGNKRIIRVAGMTDGKPVQGIPVQMLDETGALSPPVKTDAYGEAMLNASSDSLGILAGVPGHQCFQLPSLPKFTDGNSSSSDFSTAKQIDLIVLDRNLYRPGDLVKFKGFRRQIDGERLSVPPAGKEVVWTVNTHNYGKSIHTGKAVLSESGSFEGEWQVPLSALGRYSIAADSGSAGFGVVEFRPLPFSVAIDTSPAYGDTATIKIVSAYFHGAPNARAKVRWRAVWAAGATGSDEDEDEQFVTDDKYSPESPARGFSARVFSAFADAGWDTSQVSVPQVGNASESMQGEDTLDENGARTIVCKSPFKPGLYPRARVTWTVEVISLGAQTVPGVATTVVQSIPKMLGVRMSRAGAGNNALELSVTSLDVNDKPAGGLAAKVEVFRVIVHTVKERLAPTLNRYQNSPKFEPFWEKTVTTPSQLTVPVTRPGNYVVKVTAPSQPDTPPVSTSAMVYRFGREGDDEEEVWVPIENETKLSVKADRDHYFSGETATIALETPFTGTADVTVVALNRILSHEVVAIKSNTQRISIPVLPSFAPNAHVCIHLLKAAGADGIPAERYGTCELHVDRADRLLEVSTKLTRETVQPGDDVSGVVGVKSNGQPVAGADVLLFAVDNAVLELGKWKRPDLTHRFFPDRGFSLATSIALGQYVRADEGAELSQSQKGFIVGGGGLSGEDPIFPFRKIFKALAFWQPSALTNANGELPFQFKAPEGLTSYRVVAVVQNGAEQFGTAESRLRLAKSLQIEPALPEFLRLGDEAILRAEVRQDYAPSDEIEVNVERLGSALQLTEPAIRRVTVLKGKPTQVRFRAKVVPGPDHARVLLSATSTTQRTQRDAADNTLRVRPAEIELRETVTDSIAQGKTLDVAAAVPRRWQGAPGSCDVFLSGSPYLPKLASLFTMFEAEGSIEKLSSRILAATLLADTLKFLPLSREAEKRLRASIEEGVRLFETSKLTENSFREPCWPGSDKPNDFVTVQAAWALLNADRQGFLVNPELKSKAEYALASMVRDQQEFEAVPPAVRCFALMVIGHSYAHQTTTGSKPGQQRISPPNMTEEAIALFNNRKNLSAEAVAWLALGVHYLQILPMERAMLLAEMAGPVKASDFDPVTFGTTKRGEAVRLFALCEMASTNWSSAQRKMARDAFEKIAESSVLPSTQENLWLLVVFNSLVNADIPPQIDARRLTPKPLASSANQISVAWLGVSLDKFPEMFPKPLEPNVQASYLLRANYAPPVSALPPRSPGFALQRSCRNLTDPLRTGTAEAPWKLGDQVLVTYQLTTDKPHNYLEVEDQLPACLETVNRQLPFLAKYFNVPIEAGVNTLPLSNVEERAECTKLYFEKTAPGRNVYFVLERVATAGVFHWPGTQLRPMYDSRFFGFSDATTVHCVE
jgi:uncharacterized protein YfaS (alpha-2-macroglobulin family)